MTPPPPEFDHCVLACLEDPTDTAAREQRDALLVTHPEWEAHRQNLEAQWQSAQLLLHGTTDLAPAAAPELPSDVENRLMARWETSARTTPHRAMVIPWLAWAATFALFATLSFWLHHSTTSPKWGLDQSGQLVAYSSPAALLAYDGNHWEKRQAWPRHLSAAQQRLLEHLIDGGPPAPTTTLRNNGQTVEIWAPLAVERGQGVLLLHGLDSGTLELELRRLGSETPLWQHTVTLQSGQNLAVPLPTPLPAGGYDLWLTPHERPLAAQHHRFVSEPEVGATVPSGTTGALQELLGEDPAVGDIIAALLPELHDSASAREILAAVAAAHQLPALSRHVANASP